jgi:hypothetical protein
MNTLQPSVSSESGQIRAMESLSWPPPPPPSVSTAAATYPGQNSSLPYKNEAREATTASSQGKLASGWGRAATWGWAATLEAGGGRGLGLHAGMRMEFEEDVRKK